MPLKYTNMPLDRSSNLRSDSEWLASQFKRKDTLFVLINHGLNLFDGDGKTVLLDAQTLGDIRIEDCIFLGLAKESPIFSLEFDFLATEVQATITHKHQFLELKSVIHNFNDEEAAIHGFSKALHYWHSTHQFCGRCGAKNNLIAAGHARKCTQPNCGHLTFPRTDPAVIMLVEHTFPDGITRCLLGRQSAWPAGVYSTLAGFVDPGESLEEAVIRETKEETGVAVKSVRYLGSQPWPYPSSIMLGFLSLIHI